MGVLKLCERCKEYLDCEIYDKVCDILEFLQNFIDIKKSQEIAKYCKNYSTHTKKRIEKNTKIKEIFNFYIKRMSEVDLTDSNNKKVNKNEIG